MERMKDLISWQEFQTNRSLITQRAESSPPSKMLETTSLTLKQDLIMDMELMEMTWKESGPTTIFHASDRRRLFHSSNMLMLLSRDKNQPLLDNHSLST
jgi:hypothetical protein